MPISPAEARARFKTANEPSMKLLFDKIDAMLSRDIKSEYWMNVQGFGDANVGSFREHYEPLGWDVSYSSDWRDGDALVFKERK